MLQTSARLLRLLSLLQVRPDWTGPELAQRLGVTTRTVRADVDRLRDLGYPVDSRPGVTGGYRLGESATMPPMLLEDDEAVALAVGLRAATSAGLNGMDEAAVRALVKLQRLLPHRLRARVEAIGSAAITPGRSNAPGPQASADALVVIASTCRDHEWLRFDYPARTAGSDEARRMADAADPTRSDRLVEPYRLLLLGQRWYLFAWDLRREDCGRSGLIACGCIRALHVVSHPGNCRRTRRSPPACGAASESPRGSTGPASSCTRLRHT